MKTFVMIPTYNEKENIRKLINDILNLNIPNLEIIVVDDNSPDGTPKIIEDIAKKEPRVHLLLRTKNRGRGSAGIAGFKYCLENGADYVIEMDADYSHNPKYLPQMLEKIKEHDVIIGSRMVKGGKDIGRGLFRRSITKLANTYTRIILGIHIKDCNSGFRCFRKEVFDKVHLQYLFSKGPAIIQELLYKCYLAGFRIAEIPIIFQNRTKGESKLTFSKLIKGYLTILSLKWRIINNKLKL